MSAEMTDRESKMLDDLRDLLQHGMPVRIELGFAFGVNGVYPCAQMYQKNNRDRWEKVGLSIFSPEGGTRADLLALLAGLAEVPA